LSVRVRGMHDPSLPGVAPSSKGGRLNDLSARCFCLLNLAASFNLFVIVGLCMLSIPEGETRVIDGVTTFLITSTFSVMGEMQFRLRMPALVVLASTSRARDKFETDT